MGARCPGRPLWRTGLGLLALLASASAAAQEAIDELAAKATDQTASLMSFQLNDWYTARLHGADGSANQIVLRAAIPFTLLRMNHIFRVTQGYATSSPSGRTGLVDTGIFDLVTFNQPWGRWGIGIAGTAPSGANGLSTEKWTAGPALGFVNSSAKIYNWGLFAQTFFSFAGSGSAPDVRLVNLQPIFGYQLGEGRSISLGNSALVYDFDKSDWSSLMLSANYGQVVSFWGHKWRPNVEAGYDFNNDLGNQRWVFRAGITLLLPK
ncbi:MAG: hypothetical protein IPG91_11920 [Ideonella sp.]|nr:hypothetical protein [Ideonella sp.]